MADQPRFLDDEPRAAAHREVATKTEPAMRERLATPVLLEAEPDAPEELKGTWQPEDLPAPSASAGRLHWMALGIAVMIGSLAVFSAIDFVLSMASRSVFLGAASGLALSVGAGLIIYGLATEWLAYRKLRIVDRTRAALAGNRESLAALRATALSWVDQVAITLPDPIGVRKAIQCAPTVIEIQAVLRDRAAEPLRRAAQAIGWRAGLQAGSLIAVSPHASWDGVIAGIRGLLIIRDVARLFGLRPGLAVTLHLIRKVAWTAAGVSGLDLLSQSLADHALSSMPFVKHLANGAPGSAAALRLYRLANITAEACCPVAQ
jgi:putative membrane protein